LSVNDSSYVRSKKCGCCEFNLVVSPESYGHGIGREVMTIEMSIAVELGYTAMINDYVTSSERLRLLLRRMFGRKLVTIGCLSRGMYTTDVGWDDQVISFLSLEDTSPFTELAEQSRMRRVHTSKI